MTDSKADDKQAILERMMRDNEKKQQIPESDRVPITNPEKYSFPIGIGDDGKPFPDEKRERRST